MLTTNAIQQAHYYDLFYTKASYILPKTSSEVDSLIQALKAVQDTVQWQEYQGPFRDPVQDLRHFIEEKELYLKHEEDFPIYHELFNRAINNTILEIKKTNSKKRKAPVETSSQGKKTKRHPPLTSPRSSQTCSDEEYLLRMQWKFQNENIIKNLQTAFKVDPSKFLGVDYVCLEYFSTYFKSICYLFSTGKVDFNALIDLKPLNMFYFFKNFDVSRKILLSNVPCDYLNGFSENKLQYAYRYNNGLIQLHRAGIQKNHLAGLEDYQFCMLVRKKRQVSEFLKKKKAPFDTGEILQDIKYK